VRTDLTGRRLADRYVLEQLVDAGGMAEVWRARDEVLGRAVAVKVLREELSHDQAVFDRFRREAVAAARLSHPSVVRVFDTGVDQGTCFIVMELVEGRTLAARLEEGPLDPGEAAEVGRRVLDALAHAHAAGIVHRDMKPHNVLTDQHGAVKVADFGIAKAAFAGSDLTATGKLLGTARYLAPEQVTSGDVDARTDLYAVGVVLYQAITGRVPFDAETDLATATMRLTHDPPSPGALRAGVPRELDRAVMRAMARDPADRFQTAEEMSSALGRLAPGSAPPPRSPEPAGAPPQHHGSFFRSWVAVPVLLLAVAAVAVGAGLLLGRLELGGRFGLRLPSQEEEGRGVRDFRIVAAQAHDPGGDGQEHSEDAPLAIDDAPSTFWQTEGYESPNLGGLKEGVGLILDLGRSRRVARMSLATTIPGWRFEVRGSDDGVTFGEPIPSRDGGRRLQADAERVTIRLQEAEYRYVMVWITRLAADGDRFRATIADVEVGGG